MKLFYGVQGTGNGHITRARVMAKALKQAGVEVDFMFSGRPHDQFFEMEVFGDYQYRQGLTFAVEKGQVKYLKTILRSKIATFIQDVKQLDLSAYDLVISDFEPVTAWAAKIQHKPSLGIGHQYAFDYAIPKRGNNWASEIVMRAFAPVNTGLGVHWDSFGQPVLPPIIELQKRPDSIDPDSIIVYLPFEAPADIIKVLAGFTEQVFHVYSPVPFQSRYRHIVFHPLSRKTFQTDLMQCNGVISNAGFELISEALQLGKKILVKPLAGQMEQISNAAALQQLEYGSVMETINPDSIRQWLAIDCAVRIDYPDVAMHIAIWILEGMPVMNRQRLEALWSVVRVER